MPRQGLKPSEWDMDFDTMTTLPSFTMDQAVSYLPLLPSLAMQFELASPVLAKSRRLWRKFQIVIRFIFCLKYQKTEVIGSAEDLSESMNEFRSLKHQVKSLQKSMQAQKSENLDFGSNSSLNGLMDVIIDNEAQYEDEHEGELYKAMKRGYDMFQLAQIGDEVSFARLRFLVEKDPA